MSLPKDKVVLNFFRMIQFVLLFNFSTLTYAAIDASMTDGDSADSPPSIGNFTLPSSQQASPFLSFGQTLIGRNYLQLSFSTFSPYQNTNGPFNNLNTSFTYGITDNTSLYFSFPIQADSTIRTHAAHGLSSGVEDVTLQLEQAIYTVGDSKHEDQATIVGAITLPTQEVSIVGTSTGYGSPSYFLGATYNRTYVDWLGFVSPAVLLTTTSEGVRLGSQVLYQAGIGRNILYVSKQSTFSALLELDGQYTEKTRIFGQDITNSGGNVVTLTPSLSLSTPTLIAQVGVGYPIVQNLNGSQNKMDYFIAANLVWTIH